MEGSFGASQVCMEHAAELTRFTHAYLQPAALALERRDEAQPVLNRILRSLEACPRCRRRGEAPVDRLMLASGSAETQVLVRLTCTHSDGGPWRCSYEGNVKRKLLLLGDAAASKADLVRPLTFDEIPDAYRDLLGAKVMTRHETVSLPEDNADFHLVFTVWDIMGHRFTNKERLRRYLHGAKAVLAVCDLARPETVQELGYWLSVAARILGAHATVIVARGREVPDPLPISEARLREVAQRHHASVVVLPPKDAHALEHIFQGLGEDAIREIFGTRWRARMYV